MFFGNVVKCQDHVAEASAQEACEDDESVKGQLCGWASSLVQLYGTEGEGVREGCEIGSTMFVWVVTYDRDYFGLDGLIDRNKTEE